MHPIAGSIAVEHNVAAWTHHLASFLIQVGTQSRYNHSAVVSRVEGGSVYIIEAWSSGVRERRLYRSEIAHWRFEADASITATQRAEIVKAARGFMGEPYDYGDIVRFVWRFWTGKIRKREKGQSDGHVICSELVARAMYAAGINPWPGVAFDAVSPGDIADWMFSLTDEDE